MNSIIITTISTKIRVKASKIRIKIIRDILKTFIINKFSINQTNSCISKTKYILTNFKLVNTFRTKCTNFLPIIQHLLMITKRISKTLIKLLKIHNFNNLTKMRFLNSFYMMFLKMKFKTQAHRELIIYHQLP